MHLCLPDLLYSHLPHFPPNILRCQYALPWLRYELPLFLPKKNNNYENWIPGGGEVTAVNNF